MTAAFATERVRQVAGQVSPTVGPLSEGSQVPVSLGVVRLFHAPKPRARRVALPRPVFKQVTHANR